MKRITILLAMPLIALALPRVGPLQATELLDAPLTPGGGNGSSVPGTRQRIRLLPRVQPSVLPARYRGYYVTRRGAKLREKVIALTFDDGPNPANTPRILKALAQYHAKATFFVMGEWAMEWPNLVACEAGAGHAVESHSYSHPTENISEEHARIELERTETIIEQTAGAKPNVFRPPYGNMRWNMSRVAAKKGYCIVKWTICGSDHPSETPAQIIHNVTSNPQPGDIVLMHDGREHDNTARALPEILRRLTAQGYRFVTVPQLLRMWDAAKKAQAPASAPKSHLAAVGKRPA